MLAKKSRLSGRDKDLNLSRSGRSLRSDFFRVIWKQNSLNRTRFGIVVSNKVCPTIVERNRLKRQLRAAAAEFLPKIRPGFDIVIIASKPVKSFQEVYQKLEVLLGRANLFRI